MEIFETQSKYYKNPNAVFASIFSNMAVTVTAVLIGFILLVWLGISCWQGHLESKLTNKVKHHLVGCSFTIKGSFKLIDNLDYGSGQEQLRFVFLARKLKHPKLGDGEYYQYVRIVATTRSWGGAEFNVENIALENLGYDKYEGNPSRVLPNIPNWYDYASSIF